MSAETKQETVLNPLQLLILQPTPFCNIDCKYCYLPDRQNREKMAIDVVRTIYRRIAECPPLHSPSFTSCWHAGEPLVAGKKFFLDALAIAADELHDSGAVTTHSIQTNGLLIDDEWCDIFGRHDIRIGLSLDGPKELHDANRINRYGAGTHAKVLGAIDALNRNSIPYTVLSVVTAGTLSDAVGFYRFFKNLGAKRVGLNVEETSSLYSKSSMYSDCASTSLRTFLENLFDEAHRDGAVEFREFESIKSALRPYYNGSPHRQDQLTTPFAILNCDYRGNISTFAPELLGVKSVAYKDFLIGNILRQSFHEMSHEPSLARSLHDIRAGVAKCKESCDYFDLCRGGQLAAKYFEHQTFDCAETKLCQLSRKVVIDAGLSALEKIYLGRSFN